MEMVRINYENIHEVRSRFRTILTRDGSDLHKLALCYKVSFGNGGLDTDEIYVLDGWDDILDLANHMISTGISVYRVQQSRIC